MTLDTCPICGAGGPEPVFTLQAVPILCNQLWPDADSARAAPTGDIDLVICRACALIWNRAFEPDRMLYAPGYENALHFSPKFRAFAERLAADLVMRHDLAGRHVVEVGCGDGYMLELMVRHGAATAVGYDPTMAGKEGSCSGRAGVRIIPEYFASDRIEQQFDAIICRHVLEHLDAPASLLSDLRRAIGERSVPVYLEVPNAEWMLESVSMWDVIYEHVTYWTAPAMEALLRRSGFRASRIEPGYGAQFLMCEAAPTASAPAEAAGAAAAVRASARRFAAAAEAEVARLRERVGELAGRAVIWGAGSKGISCVNALGDAAGPIDALVDVNPRKHGRYVAGAGLPVVGAQTLADLQPALILLSNAQYRDEIVEQVRGLGLHPDFVVIAG